MATAADYALLRLDVGASEAELSDADAAAIFVLVEAEYEGNAGAIFTSARTTYIRRQLSTYATQASYRQNEESENLSDVFRHLKELLDYWQAILNEALAEAEAGAKLAARQSFHMPTRITW